MSRRKPKGLSEDDRQVWEAVKKTAIPMRAEKKPAIIAKPPTPPAVPNPKPVRLKPLSRIGRVAAEQPIRFDLAPDPMDALVTGRHNMDKRTHDKMRKGKLRPEARLDLHGMRAQQAHGVLTGFIQRCHRDGKRLVLVITGKGNTKREEIGIMPTRNGVLRHSLPHWLSSPQMRPMILQITPAHISHGGGGAYYVYLKRNSRP